MVSNPLTHHTFFYDCENVENFGHGLIMTNKLNALISKISENIISKKWSCLWQKNPAETHNLSRGVTEVMLLGFKFLGHKN